MAFHVPLQLALDYFLFVTVLGLGAMGVDKLLAMGNRSRIRERTLWLVALIGGFVGVFLGGWLFHHKTSKVGFWAPVVVSAVLWVAAFVYFQPVSFGL